MPLPRSAKRRFSIWSRLALSAGGAIAAILIAELIVRMAAPAWCDQWKMWRRDPVHVRGLVPGVRDAVVHGLSGEFAFRFSTNAQGLRCDRDLTIPKPPGRARCLVVGDSMTFGYGVDQGETFPDHAGRILDPRGDRVEVINAGFASGYTLDTEFLFTKGVAASWQPDVVVVGICLANDLSDLATTRWNTVEGKLVSAEKHNDWVPLWVKKSALVNLLVKGVAPRVAGWLEGDRPAESTAPERPAQLEPVTQVEPVPRLEPIPRPASTAPPALPPDASSRSPREKVAWVMQAWAHEAVLGGYRLALLPIPDAAEVRGVAVPGQLESIAGIRAVFVEVAGKAGVAVIDPLQALRDHARRTGEEMYFKLDGHLNKAGHRVLGAWLADLLRDWVRR